jgi:molecular chaperone GrpE
MSRKNKHDRPRPADEAPPIGVDAEGSTDGPADGPDVVDPAAAAAPGGDALRRERDDLLGRLQRVSADYLNYQKRVQRDVEQARQFANDELIKSLLGVLDDMERALEAGRAGHDEDDPLLTGMQLVHEKALETLGRFGLTPIEAAGEPFDPELHSAIMQQPRADCPPQTVLHQAQRGYRLKGRTIRPASVVVSSAPEQDGPTEPSGARDV